MGYITFPDTVGNYMSLADHASFDILGDIDIRVRCQPVTWEITGAEGGDSLVARGSTYRFDLNAGDALQFFWHDGAALQNQQSTVDMKAEVADGIPVWIRVTMDVDNGAADAEIKFWYSTDDTNDHTAVAWTQNGATLLEGNTTAIRTDVVGLILGSLTSALNVFEGDMYRFVIMDGIGGTVVLDADLENISVTSGSDGETFTEKSANAQTVTINGTDWSYVKAVVAGTVVAGGVVESEIVAGGETIILTLSNDTWVATVGDDNAITQALIDGIDSDGVEAAGWDAVVKANMVFGDVVRTSDTVVTITLAAEATYAITADETITATIPAAALTSGTPLGGVPTFDVTNEAPAPVTRRVISSPRYGITRSASR